MDKKIKVIIFEGIDRTGKTSTIQSLAEYIDNFLEMEVHTIYKDRERDICNFPVEHHEVQKALSDYHAKITTNIQQDIFSIGNFEMFMRMIKMLQTIQMRTGKKQVLIIDRLFLSPIIYGLYFREENFKKFWKDDISMYIEHTNLYYYLMSVYSDIIQFVVNKSENYDLWLDDNDRKDIQISINQQKELNKIWKESDFKQLSKELRKSIIKIELENEEDSLFDKVKYEVLDFLNA